MSSSRNREYLIGLDAGTTSVKGILVRTDGKVVCVAAKEYMLEYPAVDRCELDADVYWRATRLVIRHLVKQGHIEPNQVLALSLASQGETLIPVDADGKPIRKAIVWLDNRSSAEALEISQRFGSLILGVTGQPEVVPTWPATRILWLHRHEPTTFRRAKKYLLVEDFLIHRLTGRFITEPTVSSSTLYLDIHQRRWWTAMLDFIELGPEKLPEVCASGSAVGTLTRAAARATGLGKSVLVVAGAFDHAAGALGCGNLREGIVSETTGGAMAMVATLDQPLLREDLRLACQCHAVPGKYFLLPYGQTAGLVLKWFRDTFAQPEMRRAQSRGLDAYALLDALAAKVPAGADGLVLLPHLMGTGSPEFDSKVKGVFCGVTPAMGKGHFVRAILESVACMIRKNFEALRRAGVSIREVRALGGGARSRLWIQIKADCTGIPFVRFQSSEPAALGAAILAGIGCGVFGCLEEACDALVRVKETVAPDPSMAPVYGKLFERYTALYDSLRTYWL